MLSQYISMARVRSLVSFVVLVVGGGAVIGVLTAPGPWYDGLIKPPFNPPNWIFAPVWTTLYVLMAIAGWRVRQRQRKSFAMNIWWTQLALNFAWSPIFFAAHRIDVALGIIVLLLVSIALLIAACRRRDLIAAAMLVPYALWVAFATILNASLLYLNPP